MPRGLIQCWTSNRYLVHTCVTNQWVKWENAGQKGGKEKVEWEGGAYSRSWHQEGLGTNPVQFVPCSVSKWHPSTCFCPLVHLHTLPPLLPSHPPSRYRTSRLMSPWLARRVLKREGGRETTQCCPAISGTVGAPGTRGQKDRGGKPHRPLPLPVLPPSPFHDPASKTALRHLYTPRNIHLTSHP